MGRFRISGFSGLVVKMESESAVWKTVAHRQRGGYEIVARKAREERLLRYRKAHSVTIKVRFTVWVIWLVESAALMGMV